MINMGRAFTKHTTTLVYQVLMGDGYYNDFNEWQEGTETDPQPFLATPTPVGMSDYASFGATLQARPEGERVAVYLQFSSKREMPMNSFILYNGYKYKVTRNAEYKAAGFYSVIGENVLGKDYD